ncbi:MAG: copper homeostasis protein CutC [Armatimonadota bacterium]
MSALVEVVCDTVGDAREAQAAGAGRIELGCAPTLGGLTPTLGMVERVLAEVAIPVVVLVRAVPGGFAYPGDLVETMARDIARIASLGVAGVVVGALDARGAVDVEACRRFLDAAEGVETVFHRAFDCVADRDRALDTLISLGFDRILTSGGAAAALEGAAEIARLRGRAHGRIDFLPAGGIRADSVGRVLAASGCRAVHAGPRRDSTVGKPGASAFPGDTCLDVDALKKLMKEAMA